MKLMKRIRLAASLGLWAGILNACVTGKQEAAQLEANAKVTRVEAEKIALAKVPRGTIKEGEIERENGKVVWSFDLTTPGTSDITEVQVDASTGEIVAMENENLAQQAAESKPEKKRK